MVKAFFWGNLITLDTEHVQHIERNREMGLLCTNNKEAGLLKIIKEAEFMVYSWIKETSLANLSRSSLCSRAGFRS